MLAATMLSAAGLVTIEKKINRRFLPVVGGNMEAGARGMHEMTESVRERVGKGRLSAVVMQSEAL